jgi:hypothetical protein
MFRFRVEPDGGQPYEVDGKSRDVVRWEAMGRGRFIGQLEREPKMTDLAELAWCASVRCGLYQGSVKEFLSSVDVTPMPPERDDDGEEEEGVQALDPIRLAR